jgi:hypothetical protein
MKILVRAFVLVLTLTGSAAYTQINSHIAKTLAGKANSMPTPCCAPNDPNACGMR